MYSAGLAIFVRMETQADIVIIGGGAAGFFTAINLVENFPHKRVVLLERGKEVLTKVKISGGGRCNVAHAEYNPQLFVKNYPRGEKELLGPFYHFMTEEVVAWFEERGVTLKTEADGRMFPVTDSSQTIINCFLACAKKGGVHILKNQTVRGLTPTATHWEITTQNQRFQAETVVVASGSNPKIWHLLAQLGHTIIPPVPSLFTFNINDTRLAGLAGISKFGSVHTAWGSTQGPLLITHWGLSGPAILKLSAQAAREFHQQGYFFPLKVNWLDTVSFDEARRLLQEIKQTHARQLPGAHALWDIPKRLWKQLVAAAQIPQDWRWADCSKVQLDQLARQLTECEFQVHGKSTFKEEFVTAGGVDLKEIDFKTFGSKLHLGLYFAGEVLNIDAVTGGFNFQNAWTGGYIVARSMGSPK